MSESELPELPRGVALAWGVAANPQRGPKREMSVEKIVAAAIELADTDGLAAVSMAAVASKLGFTPMSLYRYVSAKDDLLLLMQEEGVGLPPEAYREADGWRAKLDAVFTAQVNIYLQHPWMLALPISGSPITPNHLAWLDATLDALADTPLRHEERVAVSLLLSGHARFYGAVMSGYADKAQLEGKDDTDITVSEAALYDALVTAEDFPAIRAAVDVGAFLTEEDPFRFGVERFFDGVDSFIQTLEAGNDRPPAQNWDAMASDIDDDKHVMQARKKVREAEKELRHARKLEREAIRQAQSKSQ